MTKRQTRPQVNCAEVCNPQATFPGFFLGQVCTLFWWYWVSMGQYLVLLGQYGALFYCYLVVLGQYVTVLGGTGAIWGSRGRYFAVLGQYWVVLFGTLWYWVNIGWYWVSIGWHKTLL